MLHLQLLAGESVILTDRRDGVEIGNITIKAITQHANGFKVTVGIEAPHYINIVREELLTKGNQQNGKAKNSHT